MGMPDQQTLAKAENMLEQFLAASGQVREDAGKRLHQVLMSQAGEYPCDIFYEELNQNPSPETIQNLTRKSLMLLLFAYDQYFFGHSHSHQPLLIARYTEGAFARLKERLPPDAEQIAKSQGLEREFAEVYEKSDSSADEMGKIDKMIAILQQQKAVTKPRIPIPYLPAAMARIAQETFCGKQKPQAAKVTTLLHTRFLWAKEQELTTALVEQGDGLSPPFLFQTVAKDAIAVLDHHGIPSRLIILGEQHLSTEGEAGQAEYQILDYRHLARIPTLGLKQTEHDGLAICLQNFHYPEFFPYLGRILKGFEHVSLRAQLPMLDYLIRQDDDGIRTAQQAWQARLAALRPHTPTMNQHHLQWEAVAEPLEQFLEAFGVCGFDKELQETLLKIAAMPDATPLLAEIWQMTEGGLALVDDLKTSYEALGLSAPDRQPMLQGLFVNAQRLLTAFAKNPQNISRLLSELGFVTQKMRLTQQIIKNASPADRRQIDPELIKTLDYFTIPGDQLVNNPRYAGLFHQMSAAVGRQFSAQDTEYFTTFCRDSHAELFVATCENRLVCFIGAIRIDADTLFLDWMTADPISRVQGITTPFLHTRLQQLAKEKNLILAAKPEVISAEVALKNGFVAGDIVVEAPGDQQLLLFRKLKSEQEYESQKISAENIWAAAADLPHEKWHHLEIEGKKLAVLKLKNGETACDQLAPQLEDENGSLVVTRLIKNGKQRLFVLEKGHLAAEGQKELKDRLKKIEYLYGEAVFQIR